MHTAGFVAVPRDLMRAGSRSPTDERRETLERECEGVASPIGPGCVVMRDAREPLMMSADTPPFGPRARRSSGSRRCRKHTQVRTTQQRRPELFPLWSLHQWVLAFFVCLVGNANSRYPEDPITSHEHSFHRHRSHGPAHLVQRVPVDSAVLVVLVQAGPDVLPPASAMSPLPPQVHGALSEAS